jgi:flagellar basal-body rod modification protein FlgD
MPDAIPATTPSLAGSLVGTARDGTAVGPGGKLGKNEFLRLLTTQLRYQDPLDPMDGKDMASDLAQFSGLEQLLNINDTLAAQDGQFDSLRVAMQNGTAMGAIGRTVVADGDKVVLGKDSATGALTGKVMADVTTSGMATLTLVDKSGREVGSRSLGYLDTGRQTFDIGGAAAGLTEGEAYQVKIEVAGGSGADLPQKVFTVGTIDGLTYGADGIARLMMGPLMIEYNAILQILT